MAKKTKKSTTKKATPQGLRGKHSTRPAAPMLTTTTAAAPVARPRPVARTRRATATPAQRRGADLVRFLRIHSKKPYGARGVNAIATLAREVGHLGNLELNATAPVAKK